MTVITKLREGPVQPFAEGVTVMPATTGAFVLFTAVKAGTLPEPVAGRPILVLSLVQVKVVPLTDPVLITVAENAPLQTAWLAIKAALGVGFTVKVKFLAVPEQLFADGVTRMFAVAGALVLFTAVKDGIVPRPLDARPMLVLSLVQANVLPLTAPV